MAQIRDKLVMDALQGHLLHPKGVPNAFLGTDARTYIWVKGKDSPYAITGSIHKVNFVEGKDLGTKVGSFKIQGGKIIKFPNVSKTIKEIAEKEGNQKAAVNFGVN